jgi:hypothetical protein
MGTRCEYLSDRTREFQSYRHAVAENAGVVVEFGQRKNVFQHHVDAAAIRGLTIADIKNALSPASLMDAPRCQHFAPSRKTKRSCKFGFLLTSIVYPCCAANLCPSRVKSPFMWLVIIRILAKPGRLLNKGHSV